MKLPKLNEDCLTLNIWTPAHKPGEKLPVIVSIHGGGFLAGWSGLPAYDGEGFARRGLVFVSMNYRLGALGFLAHPGLSKESPRNSSGNYGLQDQIAKGDYLAKDKVTEACALARTAGIASVQPELRATRKSALELAGLPTPSDAVLDLPEADYTPRVTAAKDQVTKLGLKGLKLGGKGAAWVNQLAWLGATEFAGQMTALEEVLGTTPAKPTGDPLLGAPVTETKTGAPAITLV